MNLIFIIISFVISVGVSRLIIPRILMISLHKKLFDVPNERKIHKHAIPRLGGVAFFPTILLSCCIVLALRALMGYNISILQAIYALPECTLLVCGMVLLYLTGIADDLVGVRYHQKFIIQILCASLFPIAGLWINDLYGLFGIYALPSYVGIPFTIFTVVFITNAINLIDGIDGLASGDTGSLTLGYILSFLAIKYSQNNVDVISYTEGAFVIAFSTLIVPVFDVVRVILVRFRNGKNPFEPDKNHIHHKFLAMGFTPRKSMVIILLISCTFSGLNILLMPYVNNTLMLIADILIWISLNLWWDKIKMNKLI